MSPLAAHVIAAWNTHLIQQTASQLQQQTGLIAVAFDQRNHGSRLIDKLSNEAWNNGNPRHAQDMFATYHGTAVDTSHLITYLPAYVFPKDEHTITSHMVLGVSLGGHAAWQCLLHDHRINTAIVVIGCPDYARIMSQRAEKSKLPDWTSSDPSGSKFMGSESFPKALIEAVDKWDPAGLLMDEMSGNDPSREPSEAEKTKLMPLMRDHLQDKRILNLAGGADKLVPYSCSAPFLTWLKKAIEPNGWFAGKGVVLEDKVFEGVKHEMSPAMMDEAIRFIIETLSRDSSIKQSKI